jgi:glycosyltransferase involved in cell wall biosynthesis
VHITSHVAFLVNNYPPHVGGVEQHVASLAKHLVAAGHRVTVVTLGGAPGDVIENGIRVVRLRDWLRVGDVLSFPYPGATHRIVRLLQGTGVTVISSHTRFFPMTTVAASVARKLRLPVVHTEHGSDFVRGVHALVGMASRLVDHTAGRSALRRARIVLAVSERVAVFVRRLSGVQARIFYNAVDLELWRAAARPARARLVFVGRIVPGKGWPELLDAVAAIRDSAGRPFEVAIYGAGPESDRLQEAIRRRSLGDIVTYRGQVSREVLAAEVAGAILVNPTTLAEGFQTSLIEVLAAGGRVVGYDVAGAGILADDGAPVRVVAPTADALADAVAAELSAPSAPYAADRLARWGWDQRATEYAAVLAEAEARLDPEP